MTWSPTFGVPSSTVLVTTRSACGGVTLALSWSSSAATSLPGVESTSGRSLAVTSALLVEVVSLSTRAVSVSVALASTARAPTSQTPVPVV